MAPKDSFDFTSDEDILRSSILPIKTHRSGNTTKGNFTSDEDDLGVPIKTHVKDNTAKSASTPEPLPEKIQQAVNDDVTGWSLIKAHVKDNATIRFWWESITSDSRGKEGFQVREEDVVGYEDFPWLLRANSPTQLVEYKKIADDIKRQRFIKSQYGFFANLGASFADPVSWVTGIVGGAVGRGIWGLTGLASKIGRTANVIGRSSVGAASASAIDMGFRNIGEEKSAKEYAVGITSGAILGGMFAAAPELVKSIARNGQAKKMKEAATLVAKEANTGNIQLAPALYVDRLATKHLGGSPTTMLVRSPFRTAKDFANEAFDFPFKVVSKDGEFVKKVPLESLIDSKRAILTHEFNETLDANFREFVNNGEYQYQWMAKKFPNLKFGDVLGKPMEDFNSLCMQGIITGQPTGNAAVDRSVQSYIKGVNKVTNDYLRAGGYDNLINRKTEAIKSELKKVRESFQDPQLFDENGNINESLYTSRLSAIDEEEKDLLSRFVKTSNQKTEAIKSELKKVRESFQDPQLFDENGNINENLYTSQISAIEGEKKRLVSRLVGPSSKKTEVDVTKEIESVIEKMVGLIGKKRSLVDSKKKLDSIRQTLTPFEEFSKGKDIDPKVVFGTRDPVYFTRIYDRGKIIQDPEGFAEAVADGMEAVAVEQKDFKPAAWRVYEKLIADTEGGFGLKMQRRAMEHARTLDIESKYISDYLVQDISYLYKKVVDVLVPDTYLLERFGKADPGDIINNLREEYLVSVAAATTKKEKIKVKKQFDEAADLIEGSFSRLRGESLHRDSRILTDIMNLNVGRSLGKLVTASLMDMWTIALQVGMKDFLRSAFKMKRSKELFSCKKSRADCIIHAIDAAERSRITDVAECFEHHWDTDLTSKVARATVFLSRGQWIDEKVKSIIGNATAEFIFKTCKTFAKGGEISKKEAEGLKRFGITADQAAAIYDEFLKHGEVTKDQLWVGHLDKWGNRAAADIVNAAVYSARNVGVVTPTKGATPMFFDNQLWAACFQFKRCMFAAYEKACLPFAQAVRRLDPIVISTIACGVTGAYLREYLKEVSSTRKTTHEEKLIEACKGLDGVAQATLLFSVWSDMESLTRNSYINSRNSLNFSPSVSFFIDAKQALAFALKNVNDEKPSYSELHSVRRLVPLNNVIWWSWCVDKLEEMVGQSYEIERYDAEKYEKKVMREKLNEQLGKPLKKQMKEQLKAAKAEGMDKEQLKNLEKKLEKQMKDERKRMVDEEMEKWLASKSE